MAELIRTYAWSNSRVNILRTCMWKYHLTYNVAWLGWELSAPQEKRRAYLLKNMTNVPMWIGEIVHSIIEEIINTARKTGEWKTIEQAQCDGIQLLRKGWKQSKDKRWETNPKQNINLEEHFYNQEIDTDYLKSCKNKVLQSLKAFYNIPLFDIMRNLPKENWLTIEDFSKFELNTGERVAVKIDTGFRYCDKVYLLDYKTGRVSDNVVEQLITYSMYAMKMGWAKKPEDIVIIPVYLAAYFEIGEQAIPHLNVSMDQMKHQAEIIRSEYPLLIRAFKNKDNPAHFVHTDNERACAKCHFRDMCSGAKTEISEGETPF